ncbi:BPG-independent [Mycena vulgaris]|nr:BPG-independent [Mycena vulgaris]
MLSAKESDATRFCHVLGKKRPALCTPPALAPSRPPPPLDLGLSVHDGWWIATELGLEGKAIEAGTTTNMDKIGKEHSQRRLAADGMAVGLSDGRLFTLHLNIGAGRVVWQDIVPIAVAMKTRAFHKSPTILESFQRAKDGNGRLHLLGLTSDGGVHSHITHLYALLEAAKEQGKEEDGELVIVVGRYYAMDRDKRWERIKIAIDGLPREGPVDEIKANHEKAVTDEFLKPIIVDGGARRIKDCDTFLFFNYRSDRRRELVSVLRIHDRPIEVTVPKDLGITTMSRNNADFPFPPAFPPQAMMNVLAEWLATPEVKQAHITKPISTRTITFFNGGVEKRFAHEERFMIPSPKDLNPEMSVQAEYFVMYNFAPLDMLRPWHFRPVGHTGNFDAAVSAITYTDAAVGTVYAVPGHGLYVLLVTADHGEAEQMRNADTGAPHTAHTCNPVPLILAGPASEGYALVPEDEKVEDEEEGALCDVAPAILDLLMTGHSLLAKVGNK